MAEFEHQELSASRFTHVDLSKSRFVDVDLRRSVFRDTDVSGSVMRSVYVSDVSIEGEIKNLVINGVDVVPLVEAELDRRDPRRPKMRPTDPAGYREAWDLVETMWEGTVERARKLPPDKLHESVDGEWSFIETLRHLAFASESWVHRAMLGRQAPWHPLSLPWDGMPDTPGVPRDRAVRPTLDEALELRHDRMATVRQVIDELTEEQLDGLTTPTEGIGWPPPDRYPVRECLLTVLNEEWHHRLYAERDLDVLFARYEDSAARSV